jgi:CHAD domain
LGEIRDIDVQIACVQHVREQQASLEERPGIERLLLRLQQRRHALHEPVGRAIERFTASQLAEEMEQTLDAAVENTENAAAVAREDTPITSH